jgi:Prokaryotic cytochrome b561
MSSSRAAASPPIPIGWPGAGLRPGNTRLEAFQSLIKMPDRGVMTFNSTTKWGWPAKVLHWIGAAIILVLLIHGWWMTHMTPRPERLANYAWHSALGYDLLALTVLRLLWRWFNPVPELPADLKPWERAAARVGHISLYLLMSSFR